MLYLWKRFRDIVQPKQNENDNLELKKKKKRCPNFRRLFACIDIGTYFAMMVRIKSDIGSEITCRRWRIR